MDNNETANWQPAQAVWDAFCKRHPAIGLKGGRNSWVWFNRTHGPVMASYGLMRKAINRHILIDASRFDRIAFDYLTNADHELRQPVAA